MSDEVEVVECDDFDEFFRAVRVSRFVGGPRLFRGQREVSWDLRSKWHRRVGRWEELHGDMEEIPLIFGEGRTSETVDEYTYLSDFRERIAGLPGFSTDGLESERDLWALGRHHGLVTPLLDWTKSPFIAAFFACLDDLNDHNPGLLSGTVEGQLIPGDEPVAVWEFRTDPDLFVDGEFEVFTSLVDQAYRQKAQAAVYSILQHDTLHTVEEYLEDIGSLGQLTRYEIAGSAVPTTLWYLRLMNITYGSLFPDLRGAATEVNISDHIRSYSMQALLIQQFEDIAPEAALDELDEGDVTER